LSVADGSERSKTPAVRPGAKTIVLARHGPPACPRPWLTSARGFGAWMERYDAASVLPLTPPPMDHVLLMRSLPRVVSSASPRAVSSVELLGRTPEIVPDGLLDEAPLPAPPTPLLVMPIDGWLFLSRVFWLLGWAPGGIENRTTAWRRSGEAARFLVEIAERDGSVGVVAHGWTNHWIGLRLRRLGWTRRQRSGYGPWSRLIFTKA